MIIENIYMVPFGLANTWLGLFNKYSNEPLKTQVGIRYQYKLNVVILSITCCLWYL